MKKEKHLLRWLAFIRQDVSSTLQKVIPEEQASQRVLHPTAHFYQVFQNVFPGLRKWLDIDNANCNQQITRIWRKHLIRNKIFKSRIWLRPNILNTSILNKQDRDQVFSCTIKKVPSDLKYRHSLLPSQIYTHTYKYTHTRSDQL